MRQLSKLWEMAYSTYLNAWMWASKEKQEEMEETLLYWWTRASCEELKDNYKYLLKRIEIRKRLPK